MSLTLFPTLDSFTIFPFVYSRRFVYFVHFDQEKNRNADFVIPKTSHILLLCYALQLSNLRTVEAQMGRYSGECGNGLRSNPWSRHHVFLRGREFLLDCRLY